MATPAQNLIVKNYVQADQVLSLLLPGGDSADQIRVALSVTAAGPFVVWKTSVSRQQILQNGFDWTRLDNLSAGKARVWNDIFAGEGGTLNPSKSNVRTGIDSVWVGTAADLAVREAVYVHCKRSATIVEKLLATGTGSNAVPATMGFEGAITGDEIQTAMGWS